MLSTPPRPVTRSLALAFALVLFCFPGLAAAEDFERWYSVQMGGKRAGYMHALQRTEGDRITTQSRVVIRLGRGDSGMSISMEGSFTESKDGKPISMESTQRLGNTPMTTRYTFRENGIDVESEQAGQKSRSERPLPEGTWLTPAAAGEYVRQRLAAGAQEIEVRSLDPMSGGDPTTTTRKAITRAELEIEGKRIPVYRCTAVNSAAPTVESTEHLDEDGIAVQAETRMGTIVMVLTLAGPEVAEDQAEGPELMVKTFVKPEGEITRPRQSRRAVYTLSVPSGAMPALPDTSAQQSRAEDERTARVSVVVGDLAAAPEGDLQDPRYRGPSPLLNSEDPVIIELVTKAMAGAGAAPPERAEAMRTFVHKYIRQKDLGVGFASASEVARDRQGDCSEHAVLLAAMLRADDIPARVVSGLIFADQFAGERKIFGYHMWTQALLERDGTTSWVDLDATLARQPFDATHIALAVSAMAEGDTTTSLANLVPLLGRLTIKIESIEH